MTEEIEITNTQHLHQTRNKPDGREGCLQVQLCYPYLTRHTDAMDVGMLKIIVDESFKPNCGMATIGIVFINHQATQIFSHAKVIHAGSALQTEIYACLVAIQFAIGWGFKSKLVTADSRQLLQGPRGDTNMPYLCQNLLHDIKFIAAHDLVQPAHYLAVSVV